MINFFKIMQHKWSSKNKGFTLVETLVAISIFTMSILGLMSVLTQGISDTGYAKQKLVATYLAQEGIEHARNIRDAHVLFDADIQGWANFKSDNNVTTYPSPDLNFRREVTIDPVGSDEVIISSTVKWTQGSGEQSITFSEHLFNWI